MLPVRLSRKYMLVWQLLFIVVGTSWLWAPHLNPLLSYRTSLISQYEVSLQPYSWLFRTGDVLAALLLLGMAMNFWARQSRRMGGMLLALSVGLFLDPILSTSCRITADTCQEYVSFAFVLHAIETVFTSTLFFGLAIYDSWKRQKIVSILFAIFQFVYGLLFVSQVADHNRFNTASQYVYQTVLIIWLAWFCRDVLAEKRFSVGSLEGRIVRNVTAAWAFLNGILAIIISLAHINLLGHIRGLYFTGNSAWLAQHGIAVGVVMIYLARHLARGEARARQIFLFLAGVEAIKYSVIAPDARLLLFYELTFVILFLLRDDFDRGIVPLTWAIRLRDLYFLVSGLLLSAFISLVLLDRDNRVSIVTARTAEHFSDYVFRDRPLPHAHLNSALLAHSITVFLAAGSLAILWVLFRPYKISRLGGRDEQRITSALSSYSNSSEDFFKLWPRDKEYFWSQAADGFIAYKITGPVAFVLADPIAKNQKKIIREFGAWCRERRLKICYLPVFPNNLRLYQSAGLDSLQIGSSALVNISQFLNQTVKDKWWRWRINKSNKQGFTHGRSRPPHAGGLVAELKKISDIWLESGHQERGFSLGHFSESYLQRCNVHYLRDADGRLAAFTNEIPQFKKHGILTIDMLRSDPRTDSMAYLLNKMIEAGQDEYKYFDLGFVPFTKAKGPLQAIAKTVSSDSFSAKGVEQFKNKFKPDWQPIYLTYEGDMADLAVIALHIENAMALKI